MVAERPDGKYRLTPVGATLRSDVPGSLRSFALMMVDDYNWQAWGQLLHGVRSEAETRELIARENRHYARRQLIWFRKEPNLVWLPTSGEDPETLKAVEAVLKASGVS